MPTKGKKRASTASASILQAALCDGSPMKESPSKKTRVDPIFAEIIETLQGAESLNEHCREMLVVMAVPSLSTPKSDRHDMQQLGVRMIGEALKERQSKLVDAVTEAQTELAELEESQDSLKQKAEDAKALLEKQQEAKAAAQAAHEEATAAAKASEITLSEARDAEKKADEAMAALAKEKADIDAAYMEHFKTPMESGQGPSHYNLQPFLDTLGLEEALIRAMPSSCVKTKEQRGGFDDLVLAQLDTALLGKIAALEKSVLNEASAVSENKAAVISSESALEEKQIAEKTASTNLEAAVIAQSEAQEAVDKATEEWKAFEPRVNLAADTLSLHGAKRGLFEDGPLKNFLTLQDQEFSAPDEEAATAGA